MKPKFNIGDRVIYQGETYLIRGVVDRTNKVPGFNYLIRSNTHVGWIPETKLISNGICLDHNQPKPCIDCIRNIATNMTL